MTEQNPKPIIVAVGHDPIDAALRFAAGEAERAGCGLHLVHVVHLIAQGPEMALVAETDLERAGRQALNVAVERARDLVSADVRVTCEARVGGVVPTLVELAAHARMVVLEHRDLSRMKRVVTRSVSSGVAAHARVPVVSVPSQWSPPPIDGGLPTVTVGVDVPERAGRVLSAAAAEAKSRGALLHVVHTWSFPSAYDDIILTRTESEEWAARATNEIQAAHRRPGRGGRGRPGADRGSSRLRGRLTHRSQPRVGPSGDRSARLGGAHRLASGTDRSSGPSRDRLPGPARRPPARSSREPSPGAGECGPAGVTRSSGVQATVLAAGDSEPCRTGYSDERLDQVANGVVDGVG